MAQFTQLLEAIRNKLIADYVANTTTWKCFIGYTPDDQDQVISLTSTGGYPFDTLNECSTLPTFQVNVRSPYLARTNCESKWWEIFNCLKCGPPPYRIPLPGDPPAAWRDLSNYGVCLIEPMQTAPLEWLDAKDRVNMSLNYRVVLQNA